MDKLSTAADPAGAKLRAALVGAAVGPRGVRPLRAHVHVENDVKQAKDLGLDRRQSRHWAINVACTQVVALAANLLACCWPYPQASYATPPRNCCATGCWTYPPA